MKIAAIDEIMQINDGIISATLMFDFQKEKIITFINLPNDYFVLIQSKYEILN